MTLILGEIWYMKLNLAKITCSYSHGIMEENMNYFLFKIGEIILLKQKK